MKYFNIYGIFHITFPVFINSMLLFNLFEFGFDMMSAGLYVGFFVIITSVTVFSQLLTEYVTIEIIRVNRTV